MVKRKHRPDHVERLLIKQHKVVLVKINELQKQLKIMSKELDDLNAKLDRQDTAIAGVAADVAWLKAKIDANPGGLNATEVAAISARLETTTAKLEALDSETDSTQV